MVMRLFIAASRPCDVFDVASDGLNFMALRLVGANVWAVSVTVNALDCTSPNIWDISGDVTKSPCCPKTSCFM